MSAAAVDDPYLAGGYAPIEDESTFVLEPAHGAIPRDLNGVYVRNGPNPRFEAPGRHHWFDGDAMLHAVKLEDGEATYRNRYVRTPGFLREQEAGRALWSGLLEPTDDNPSGEPYKDTGNTDVLSYRGALYTLWYVCGAAHRIDPVTLESEGPATFGQERPMRMSAHAKVDPRSGELVFFDYGPRPPFMRYGVIADGRVDHLVPIELPGPRLPHDMAITERFSVLMDLPVFPRPEALKQKRWIVQYDREQPARFGILPRRGGPESIRWFSAEPCYVYHVVNAWEEGDTVVMVGCRCDDPLPEPRPEDGPLAGALANLRLRARLYRWRFDLRDGSTSEEALDDRNTEFPTIADALVGQRSRWSYHMTIPEGRTLLFDGIAKYDVGNGGRRELSFGPGRFGSEAPFAPRDDGCAEDDGYLLSFVDDRTADQSELWIVAARDMEVVTKLPVPRRVPLGFHACWVPGSCR